MVPCTLWKEVWVRSGWAFSLQSLQAVSYTHLTLALTGEVSLHGQVLPVGGVEQKLAAAKEAGDVYKRQVYMKQKILTKKEGTEIVRGTDA